MRARLLVNPACGGGRGERLLTRLAGAAGREGAPISATRDVEDLVRQARRALADGVDRLLVAGGDGTLHHVIQVLAGSECALAPVPAGRGNDLAASLGVPSRPERAVRQGLRGEVRRIDLGRVTAPGPEGGSRLFAVHCGVGFDSEVVRFAARPRAVRGPLVYAWGVLRTLAGFTPPVYRIEHDGGAFEGPGMLAVAANCPRFGGGMKIAPAARLDDGVLDLVVARRVSKPELLRVFPRVYRGTHLSHPAVFATPTHRLRVALDREMTIVGDGESLLTVGPAGAEVEVLPGALRVVAGPGAALGRSGDGVNQTSKATPWASGSSSP